jgi:hypothetical protein
MGKDRLNSWARFLNALGNCSSKIVWTFIGIIVLAAIGRFLYVTSQQQRDQTRPERSEASIAQPIPWDTVDEEIAAALRQAHAAAESYADAELGEWTDELQRRIDDDFLEWYFSYWQQQWLGLRSMGYWIADRAVVERVIGDQPSMAERITEEIQEEFSRRVLRPGIAQLRLERIADATVRLYVTELSKSLADIPEKYRIPKADWERHLDDLALLTAHVEGNREVSLTLKTVTVSGAAGGTVAAAKVAQVLKPAIAKIGTKMTAGAAAEGAGKIASSLASKTGAKVGAKVGGKFLGAIIGVGVIVWDVWDHRRTGKVQRPVLRKNLADYLAELQQSLLYEPETGLMIIIDQLEANVVASLPEPARLPRKPA